MAKKDKEKEIPVTDEEDVQEDQTVADVDDTEVASEETEEQPKGKGNKKPKKEISRSKAQKEWEDSIVSNKRVKREENRHKLKVAMIVILIVALIVTSTVYLMLLFVEGNSIKITATNGQDKKLSLSLNGETWAPIISANGPKNVWNVSYNREDYNEDASGFSVIPKLQETIDLVTSKNIMYGTMPSEHFIYSVFTLKNEIGRGATDIETTMSIESNSVGLDSALRVMWVEGYSNTGVGANILGKPIFVDDNGVKTDQLFSPIDYHRYKQKSGNLVKYNIYAARSYNKRLENLMVNIGRNKDIGYTEMVSYPIGTGNGDEQESMDTPWYYLDKYENEKDEKGNIIERTEKIYKGFFPASPFVSEDVIFKNNMILKDGEKVNICMVVWLEGSDLECLNDKLNGELSIKVNFKALS